MLVRSFGWIIGVIALVLASITAVGIFWHNVRIWRMRRAYKQLPTGIEKRVLQIVQDTAAHVPSVTLLRLDKSNKCDNNDALCESHVGGVPFGIAGDNYPSESNFLLQVRLDEPSLGEQWQGRLLTVFMVFDFEQVVRSYDAPTLDQYVPVTASGVPRSCIRLTSMRFPADIEEKCPASPLRLCKIVPDLPRLLHQFTKDHVGLLSQILYPDAYGYDLENWQVAYVGGNPTFVQQPHEPSCDECGDPMQFLFQFGEIIPGVQMADAGVFYVYGCDRHPHCCKGFIQSH
jgi:hypothetical protein